MGLGDDLMWLGEASKVHERYPDVVITDGREFSPLWENIPWVVAPNAKTDKQKALVPRKPGGQRWYIENFVNGRVLYKKYNPIPAPYVITKEESERADKILEENGITESFVLVNPDTKNTTLATNKDWGFGKWQKLTNMLKEDIMVVRLKPKSGQDISGYVEYKQPDLENCTNIFTDDVRIAFAIASKAKAIVTPEGGLHHFAAAVNVPAFVIYGGVITPDITGYKDRNQTYYVYEHSMTPCGKQSKCDHCREAMDSIKPEAIYNDVKKVLC